MIPKNRIPTHPGQVLLEDFLIPMKIPQTQLADHLKISVQRINELVNGKRGVTPETAWLLAAAFQTSPAFWMNLQAQHDLAKNRPTSMLQAIRSLANALPRTRRGGATAAVAGRGTTRSSRRAS
jgi:addiction module HigA family antidote